MDMFKVRFYGIHHLFLNLCTIIIYYFFFINAESNFLTCIYSMFRSDHYVRTAVHFLKLRCYDSSLSGEGVLDERIYR